jgi:hypothetical protein
VARKSRETEGSSRRRKRNVEKKPRAPKKKKTSPAVTIIAVLAVMVIAWSVLLKEDDKVPSGKIAPAIVGVLDQVYLGCTVFWFNQGSHLLCDQSIADKLHDSEKGGITVTVTNALRKEFSAIGKHNEDRMVFRVDSNGEIYIKAKECETNIDQVTVSELNLEELEAQCKPK